MGSRCSTTSVVVKIVLLVLAVGRLAPAAAAHPGEHIKVGDAEITPSLLTGVEYRSNIYLEEKDPFGGFGLRIFPSIGLDLEREDITLGLDYQYQLQKFLTPGLSVADRFRDMNLSLDVDALPKSVLGVRMSESLVSSGRETQVDDETYDSGLIRRTSNDLSGGAIIRPGNAIDIDVGGKFRFDDYNVPDEVETYSNLNNRVDYGPEVSAKWRFFPRTAVIVRSYVDWFGWTNNLVSVPTNAGSDVGLGNYIAIPDGYSWGVEGGLAGKITEKLSTNLQVGYSQMMFNAQSVIDAGAGLDDAATDIDPASGFDENATGLDGILVTTTFKYDATVKHRFELGYSKALRDSYFTNYIAYNYFFAGYTFLPIETVTLATRGGFRLEKYVGEVARDDSVIMIGTDEGWQANKWLKIEMGGRWDRRRSSDASVDYDDFTVRGGVILTY